MLVLAAGLGGCGDGQPTSPGLLADDCLKSVSLASLPQAIRACDAVVRTYPRNPLPLRDRALLLSLDGNEAKACRDLHRARDLVSAQPLTTTSRRLLADLLVSLRSCPSQDGQP